MKEVFCLNQGWMFSKIVPESFDGHLEAAERVNLPHTWNNIDPLNEIHDMYRGKCVYQKDLPIPSELQKIRLYLEFAGVNTVCELFIDGKLVGTHKGGFSKFRFDISKFVTYGKNNIITVTADNSIDSGIYPLQANYMSFGGIYRDVNLIIANTTHFALDDYGSPGIYVVPRVTNGKGRVGITSEVSEPVNYDIVNYAIYDPNDCIVGQASVHPKKANAIIEVDKPDLWQGRLSPNLYTLKAKLIRDGEVLDWHDIQFGFRTLEFDQDNGFFLNGTKTTLKGVSRYQDIENYGWAMNPEQIKADIKLIKEIGANAVRLPFYQNDDLFYELCDKEGIIVWTELPVNSEVSVTLDAKNNINQQISEMVKQCYNHPSICFFGIHSDIVSDSERVIEELTSMNEAVKQIDKFLLTVSTMSINIPSLSKLNEITDLIAYNTASGNKFLEPDSFAKWFDELSSGNGRKPVAIAEYGCEGMSGPVNYPRIGAYSEENQALYHEEMWKKLHFSNNLWASFVSTMFDYSRAISNPENNSIISYLGLVSYDRTTKKDAFFFYKSQWSKKKFMHICGRRYEVRSDKKMLLRIYTNCPKVFVLFNDKERPIAVSGNDGVYELELRLQRGENKIKAFYDELIYDEVVIIRSKNAELGLVINSLKDETVESSHAIEPQVYTNSQESDFTKEPKTPPVTAKKEVILTEAETDNEEDFQDISMLPDDSETFDILDDGNKLKNKDE